MGASRPDSLPHFPAKVRRSNWAFVVRLCAVLPLALSAFSHEAHAHWPGQPVHQFAELGDLKLESGEVIKNFRMSYVTHGKLNSAKDNAILYMHGFAQNHHSIDHMIGPGRPLDTDRYFVICPDTLGATQTNFEHTTSPSNSGLKMKFPQYIERDMVNAQHRLITETLGISHLLAVTGISMGGREAVQFAVSYPRFMDGIFPIVGGAVLTATAAQGRLRGPLMRSNITSCNGWDNGEYIENPQSCASNAMSMLASYFYTTEWWRITLDTPEAYTKWRNGLSEYLDVQDARDLLYLMRATGRVGDTPGFDGDLVKALGSIKARTLLIYNRRDQLLLAEDFETELKSIPNARALVIDSIAGHAIAGNADPQATRAMGEAIRHFLGELNAQKLSEK
jgi:homoserine O-acetyltransferase